MTQRCDICKHWKHWEAAMARPYPDDMICRGNGPATAVFTRPDWYCADWVPREGVEAEESTDSLLARAREAMADYETERWLAIDEEKRFYEIVRALVAVLNAAGPGKA